MKLFLGILIVWCTLWGRTNLYAQKADKRIDSLAKMLLHAGEDTNKVLLLDELSYACYTIVPDEGLKYGWQELALAQKLGWRKGEAMAYHSIGDNYLTKSNFPQALDYYFRAIKINEELGYAAGLAKSYNHLGVIYKHQKSYARALDYYTKALAINERNHNNAGIALNLSNMGNIYCYKKDYIKALEYDLRSLDIYIELGDSAGLSHVQGNVGLVYKNKGDYPRALEYYFMALKTDESLREKNEIEVKLTNIGECYLKMSMGSPVPRAKKTNVEMAVQYLKRAMVVAEELHDLVDVINISKHLSEAEAMAGHDKGAFDHYVSYVQYKDSVFSMENNEHIIAIDYKRKMHADSLKTEDEKKTAAIELQYQRKYTYIGFGVVVLLLGFSLFIVKERGKSERLLLNILPASVAAELKEKGVTTARQYEHVTVLFAQFANFNKMSEQMPPEELIGELDVCFKAFDSITAAYGVEKIKTIGDTYLAAAGLPLADPEHAVHAVNVAMEMQQFMDTRKNDTGDKAFELHIGIHSGSVVAGVVGVRKFAYDIWGDTVNTAARMKQKSAPGRINISQTTYELVKDKFACAHRGEVEAKNKGKLDMYFVVPKTDS